MKQLKGSSGNLFMMIGEQEGKEVVVPAAEVILVMVEPQYGADMQKASHAESVRFVVERRNLNGLIGALMDLDFQLSQVETQLEMAKFAITLVKPKDEPKEREL